MNDNEFQFELEEIKRAEADFRDAFNLANQKIEEYKTKGLKLANDKGVFIQKHSKIVRTK